ncbi:acetyl-CoA transferase [Actinomycetospora endophytica]|uniref:Acetyl-CoA transferase n=1 Tax=Actinomycetospora endophytica TaxID=2291215 RepID=A0ABS8PHL7_9PSEU|nr:acetyl-CoA hydrolase/transferase C-terminal domain-containing protein [Actinomycetospora endophytica]MCD2197659.1 acetyl-CoA transferase [Actinomycetospora endophytica]
MITDHLRPGDTVVVGQTSAEPPTLVDALLDARTDVTAFVGYTANDAWRRARCRVVTYVAGGVLRRVPTVEYLPTHLSRVEEHVVAGRLAADVVLLRVGPADVDGFHDLGPTVDYVWAAAQRARVVLVEVDEHMPRTRSRRRLHRSLVTEAFPADRPPITTGSKPPSELDRAVAGRVAALVPDGAAVQLGLGGLADAVAAELGSRRGLRMRSGLVGDWLPGLAEAGALDSVVAGMTLGGPDLYAFLDDNPIAEFAPGSEITAAVEGPFVAVNSAVEVDLLGQIGAEYVGDRLVGGVGGQVDFLRAAHGRGVGVVALPSVTTTGATRIVPRLADPVTTSKSDVDVVVTEHGVADLRACTVRERAERLIAVAHPDHRAGLTRE